MTYCKYNTFTSFSLLRACLIFNIFLLGGLKVVKLKTWVTAALTNRAEANHRETNTNITESVSNVTYFRSAQPHYFLLLITVSIHPPLAPSEYHAHLSSHVPQRAQQPVPAVPPQAGCPDADPGYLESYAQPLPQTGGGQSEREAGLERGVHGTSHHDGSAHPRGEQVRICKSGIYEKKFF